MQAELQFVPHEQRDAVLRLGYLSNADYDELLSENIVFLDLYDSSANNALIECIVRGTPVLVNPLAAVIEYLGPDYPLYFNNLAEAAEKISLERLVLEAHDYLMSSPVRSRLTGGYFLERLMTSDIFLQDTRPCHVRKAGTGVVTTATGVPKTIYSLWLQGRGAAPDLVRFNFERWTALNPDYRLKVLDRRDVLELLEGVDLPIWELPIQALSDVVRARLLRDNGGVWVDASVFPVKPLSQWLDDALTDAGFFAFERPAPDRPISSWFLAATPRNLIFREWWKQIERFWSKPRRLIEGIPADPVASVSPDGATGSDHFPYFWFHYLFQYLLESNVEFAETWNRCARMAASAGAGRLQALFANTPNPSVADIRSATSVLPMQKLNWRVSYPLDVLAGACLESRSR